MTLEERLENVKRQQKEAEQMFFKCAGAIELLNSLIEEKESDKKGKK
jgi:hypothetical protein